MDTVQMEKLVAMKRYAKKQLLISSIIQYSLQASVLGMFLSSPSWLPKLYCAAKLLLSVAAGPKCLFLLSNIIIIFLVSESRVSRHPRELDVYEEECAAVPPGSHGGIRKGDEGDAREEEEEIAGHVGDVDVEVVEEEKVVMVVVDDEEERERGCVEVEEEEEERGLPAEELKRRAEDFIAKVNMQRRLEAMMIIRHE